MRALQQTFNPAYISTERKPFLLTRFFDWCKGQEKNRLGWIATILAIHGCALTPITLFMIYLGGNDMTFWALAISAMGMSLVTNLAALPTKITIPVFALSVLVDLTVIVMSVMHMSAM